MKNKSIKLTPAQFAKLHEINKRTLHYYDEVGLFHPQSRSKEGYRYYDISQSIDFEYIRMLKELNMSIEEINTYIKNPTPSNFIEIANEKIETLEKEIQKLKNIKTIMNTKRNQILFCETLSNQEIRIEDCASEEILIYPYDFEEDNISNIFHHLKNTWGIEQIRMGIGSFISLNKIYKNNFEIYDGLYTVALEHTQIEKKFIKPGGQYLCGYQKGTWDTLPCMYQKMIAYAKKKHIHITGYAYEVGLNDFVISNPNEYITKIMIQIKNT